MKCSFSRLLYPKRLEEARDGSYMIALFKPNEKVLDAQGNRLSSIKVVGHFLPTVASVKVDMTGHWKKDARYGLQFEMESYEEIVGSDKRSIVAYLSSGMIPGSGASLRSGFITRSERRRWRCWIKTLRVSRKCLASARRSARSFARHIWRHGAPENSSTCWHPSISAHRRQSSCGSSWDRMRRPFSHSFPTWCLSTTRSTLRRQTSWPRPTG